jgi:hypothetical protein
VTAGSLILHSNVSDSGCGVVEILVRNFTRPLIAAWTGGPSCPLHQDVQAMCLPQIGLSAPARTRSPPESKGREGLMAQRPTVTQRLALISEWKNPPGTCRAASA